MESSRISLRTFRLLDEYGVSCRSCVGPGAAVFVNPAQAYLPTSFMRLCGGLGRLLGLAIEPHDPH